jgi:hypothetical protein
MRTYFKSLVHNLCRSIYNVNEYERPFHTLQMRRRIIPDRQSVIFRDKPSYTVFKLKASGLVSDHPAVCIRISSMFNIRIVPDKNHPRWFRV